MAKSRSRKLTIANLVESTDTIVYVVDREYTILLANSACCDWTGLDLSDLVGTRCIYASGELENQTRDKVKGLCPPPQVFEGHTINGSLFVTCDDQQQWRHAYFTPIAHNDSGVQQVLVIASPKTIDQPPVSPTQELRHELHALLSGMRNESADRYNLTNLIGQSPFANRLVRQIEAAANSDSDTIVVGPKHSGREHIANTVFYRRKKSDAPLVTIHCQVADGAMIQQRIREWGMEQKQRPSQDWILLLDVDELDELAQQELLGFTRLPDFSLRTIATSSRSLIEMSNQNLFNQDLAYHLSSFVIQTVPLCERAEDIPPLAQAFLESENVRRSRQLSGFSTAALELICEYDWPRNIDQLSQAIASAANHSRSSWIEYDDMPEEIRMGVSAARLGTKTETAIDLNNYLESIEQELISRALIQSKNNRTHAAKLLNISRARLLRRIAYFKIEPAQSVKQTVDASIFKEANE